MSAGQQTGERDVTFRDVAEADMPAEGMGLIADVMAASARERDWINEQVAKADAREIDRLRAENARLRRTLAAARERIDALFADPGPDFWGEGR